MYFSNKGFNRQFFCSALVAFCLIVAGCSEANFKLAAESRLPKWFELPVNAHRDDLTVTMDYYVDSNGREAVFKLFDKNGLMILKVTGKLKGLYPIKANGTVDGRPSYEIITVNGTTEVIEHRSKNNFFHIAEQSILESQ